MTRRISGNPTMLALLMLASGLLLSAAAPMETSPLEPTLKRAIAMPGVEGRIDHLTYDAKTGRLFVAALGNGTLEVIDLARGERIKSIAGLKEPPGVAVVPSTAEIVVACGGDGTLRAYDPQALIEKRQVKVGDDADNVRVDAEDRSVIVGYGSGALAILDAATLKPIGEIKLPGHPESFQLDPGSARVFVNVPGGAPGGSGAVLVGDCATQAVLATWELKEAAQNFPMALDAARRRLYIGCRQPAKLLLLDADTGKTIASADCVGDADDLFADARTGLVYVVGGAGAIEVFAARDDNPCTRVASLRTRDGARTALLVPELQTLFVALPKRSGQDAEIRQYTLPEVQEKKP